MLPFRAALSPVAIVTWAVERTPALPGVLRPVLVDGRALVSLVAFRNVGLRPVGVPGPGLSFAQANLRTYARSPSGGAVVFLTALVRSRRAAALGWLGAPYRYAGLSVLQQGGAIEIRADGLDVRVAAGLPARCDPALTALVCAEREAWIAWGPLTLMLGVEREATSIVPAAADALDVAALRGVVEGEPLCAHVVETGEWRLAFRPVR
jgi:uncharacterized protein YqjF (DUF2071 family)